jgi:hypothetical protein
VFREPGEGDTWICRRDAAIRLPYDRLIVRTTNGIPYCQPEVALLFKATNPHDKDDADFARASRTDHLAVWFGQAERFLARMVEFADAFAAGR